MPTTLQPRDRNLLILAGALLAVVLVLSMFAAPSGESVFPPFSSYSPQKDGAKGAYTLLSESGYRIERWEQPLSDLPQNAEGVLLILAAPVTPVSKLAISEEKDALEAFLNRGGSVLATDAAAGAVLPEASVAMLRKRAAIPTKDAESDDEEEADKPEPTQRFAAITPSRITRNAPAIEMRHPPVLLAHAESRVEHYEGRVVVSYNVGRGEVIWWADTWPLTNEGLPRASNLELLLNSVGRSGVTTILWDEHFHGDHQDLLDYFGRTPAKWLLVQLLLVFAAALASAGRRHGPLVQLHAGGSRLSPLEFVETLGDLYARKAAAPEALETAYQRFRFLLTRRLGLPPSAKPERIAAAVTDRWTVSDPAFLELLQECDRAEHLHEVPEKRALWLVGELHDRAAEWRL
jgi:hypothetical protein